MQGREGISGGRSSIGRCVSGIVGLALTLTLSGCATQKYHRGRIIPIRSVALPDRPIIVARIADPKDGRRDLGPSRHKAAAIVTPPQRYLSVPGGVASASARPIDGEKRTDVAGLWHVRWDKGDCYIQLINPTDQIGAKARPMACNGGPISSVSSWRRDGKDLLLLETDGRNAASLRSTERASFEGSIAGAGGKLQLDREQSRF